MLTIIDKDKEFTIDLYNFKYRQELRNYTSKLITIFVYSDFNRNNSFRIKVLNRKIDLVEIEFRDISTDFTCIFKGNIYLLISSLLTTSVEDSTLNTYTHDMIDMSNMYRRMRENEISEIIIHHKEE